MLRPHRAADGALLRLRLPGGWLPAPSLEIISEAAVRFGDGDVQLTSRANLQLRAVSTDPSGAVAAPLVDEVLRAGLLPHPSHERVRNIVCSPLSGLSGGLADLRPLVTELDEKLCAADDLAALPGPFLFALDDGRGDLDVLPADLRVRAVDRHSVQVLVADSAIGPVLPLERAADLVIALGRAFLRVTEGETRWHVRELPQRGLELFSQVNLPTRVIPVRRKSVSAGLGLGRLTQENGRATLSALAPLGLLDRRQTAALTRAAALGSGHVVVTPWRGILVPDLPASEAGPAADLLAAAGLQLDDRSPWRGVTACTGAPKCAHGEGETRPLAGRIVRERAAGSESGPAIHVVGCARRCGSPNGPHLEVLTSARAAEISRDGLTTVVPIADAPAAVWGSR